METRSEELKPVYGNPMSHENAGITGETDSCHFHPADRGYDIFTLVQREEELLKDLMIRLENEILGILEENSMNAFEPPQELEILFRRLYAFFQGNPHFLALIFDKDLRAHCVGADEIVSRLKRSAFDYLKGVIDNGKDQGYFTHQTPTKSLVVDIMGSFRGLMNDVRLADKMIGDLKKIQTENE
ncbi:MAG TPA: hypothetical protein DCY35_05205 [Prolixibacteraceae bacterium]|nr:hypothetical protein [Prolixibacteraceae bacterium]